MPSGPQPSRSGYSVHGRCRASSAGVRKDGYAVAREVVAIAAFRKKLARRDGKRAHALEKSARCLTARRK
jgi:hypothetical protein